MSNEGPVRFKGYHALATRRQGLSATGWMLNRPACHSATNKAARASKNGTPTECATKLGAKGLNPQ